MAYRKETLKPIVITHDTDLRMRWARVREHFTENEIRIHHKEFVSMKLDEPKFLNYMEYLVKQKEDCAAWLADQKSACLLNW